MPEAKKTYYYAIRYYIVDSFGDLLFDGRVTVDQGFPWPSEDNPQHGKFISLRKELIRRTLPANAPDGNILIAAVTPV